MTTLWCPRCRSEYREGFVECADCGVALVAALPPEPAGDAPPPDRWLRPEDEPVEVFRVNAVEAEMVAARLRAEGIRADVFGVSAGGELAGVQYSQGSQVRVPRADVDVARAVLRDLEAASDEPSPIDDRDLAAQAEAADWSDPGSGAVV